MWQYENVTTYCIRRAPHRSHRHSRSPDRSAIDSGCSCHSNSERNPRRSLTLKSNRVNKLHAIVIRIWNEKTTSYLAEKRYLYICIRDEERNPGIQLATIWIIHQSAQSMAGAWSIGVWSLEKSQFQANVCKTRPKNPIRISRTTETLTTPVLWIIMVFWECENLVWISKPKQCCGTLYLGNDLSQS